MVAMKTSPSGKNVILENAELSHFHIYPQAECKPESFQLFFRQQITCLNN